MANTFSIPNVPSQKGAGLWGVKTEKNTKKHASSPTANNEPGTFNFPKYEGKGILSFLILLLLNSC